MGTHDAPVSWLERWQQQEPLRLWLWTVACAVIVLAGVAGWLTAELAVAITGVAAAVLMLGGTAAARRQAYAPATVNQLLADRDERTEELLEEQHALSYRQGELDAVQRQAEQVSGDVPTAGMRAPEVETALLRAQVPETRPRRTVRSCPFMDSDGRRCLLPEHPRKVGHRLEAVPVGE